MLFTLFFLIICFTRKYNFKNNNSTNDKNELIEVDNILHNLHNPIYYENYWSIVYHELLFTIFTYIGVCICIYYDLIYIYYIVFGE